MVFTLFRLHTQKKVAIATSRNLIPKNSVLTGENVIVDNNKKYLYFITTFILKQVNRKWLWVFVLQRFNVKLPGAPAAESVSLSES